MKVKTEILGILICIMLIALVIPISKSMNYDNNNIEKQSIIDDEKNPHTVTTDVDWWPMFRHDLQHTAYTTSTGPNMRSILWSYKAGCNESSPAVVDGQVYIGSDDGRVYCLDAKNGN